LSHAVVDLLNEQTRPLHVAEIATRLGVRNRTELGEVLENLVYEGVLLARPGRRYRVAPCAGNEGREALEGLIHVNARGFAFVRVLGSADDVFVPAEAIGGAMHGDKVRVRVVARSRRGREGEVTEVIGRGRERVVGVLRGRPGQFYVEPDDSRVRGPIEVTALGPQLGPPAGSQAGGEPRAGLAVAVTILRYPDDTGENPQGRLDVLLGVPGEPDVEVAKVLVEHGIDETHPADALAEAQAFGAQPRPEDFEGREDLRHVPFIAIDPADARDHDDAVCVERDDDGNYRAWIAIADVSHYVREGSALDASAEARGCSVYLPDRAVPMLPPNLSATLCSLLPNQDRLALGVEVQLDSTGAITKVRPFEAVIRVRAFVSYDATARALGFTTEPARDPEAEERRHEIRIAWDLSSQLRKRRMRRGALDLDVPEAHVQVDPETRAPVAVTQRSHDPGVRKTYRLVEELMLLANESIAKLALERGLPVIFRVHGTPDPEKVERFAAQCSALGVTLDVDDATDPKRMSKFLRKIESHPKKQVLHSLMLRSLQQAVYEVANVGHFGLASPAYLHFTSPIRRYPDLVVHRMLRRVLRKERIRDDEALERHLREAAVTASERERNAMEAERDISDLYRALYMRSHIGDMLEGTVTSVTPVGVYLRIDDPFLDVLVPTDALGMDAYEPDELSLKVVGRRSGDTIALGDTMLVVIEDVSIQRRAVFGKRIAEESNRRTSSKERKRMRRDTTNAAKRGKGPRKSKSKSKSKSKGKSKGKSKKKDKSKKGGDRGRGRR
jgi:ribonuclease R